VGIVLVVGFFWDLSLHLLLHVVFLKSSEASSFNGG